VMVMAVIVMLGWVVVLRLLDEDWQPDSDICTRMRYCESHKQRTLDEDLLELVHASHQH